MSLNLLKNEQNKRVIKNLDIVFSVLGLCILMPILATLTLYLTIFHHPAFFFQRRVGAGGKHFTLIKFRTMRKGTIEVPSHTVDNQAITKIGSILRKTKIDEIPQLLNVVMGEMSLVGPRPCLPSQIAVIVERSKVGVTSAKPGITGLAQIMNVDMSRPKLMAKLEFKMVRALSPKNYLCIIICTFLPIFN